MPRKASVFLIMLFFIFQFFQCVCWSRNSNTLATWCEELTHLKRPWCWERLTAGGEEHDRGWDGWMASSTQWTWVWVDSRNWWWTGRPGMLQLMGSQRVARNWELNWTELSRLLWICYNKYESASIFWKYLFQFFWIYTQKWNFWLICKFSF